MNNAPLTVNSLRQVYGNYPGMGSADVYVPALYNKTLQYNALQMQVVRRLTNGLQIGFAYTLAKGEGYTGYDPYTDQIGGEAAIHARYWGPTSDDRRHNISATWSYDIPTLTEIPVLKQLIMDWQFSGIFRMLSGQAITPTCSSNNAGINNSNPSLTDGVTLALRVHRRTAVRRIHRRSERPGSRSSALQPGGVPHAAAQREHRQLRRQRPVGILRHPTWHEWDITLSRRFPINLMGRKNSGIRLRYEVYNVFNEVQFTNMNASYTFTGANNSVNNNANTGKYTATGTTLAAGTITPRVMALTVRLDW